MYLQTKKQTAAPEKSDSNVLAQTKKSVTQKFSFVDNRPKQLQQPLKTSPEVLFQLKRNRNRKKRQKKREKEHATNEELFRMKGEGPFPIAFEGERRNLAEETYENPKLFWRGDDRTYDAVIKTGFTTKNERDGVSLNQKNIIKWRAGNNQDDIDPDSGVCVAADVRGAAFFPLANEAKYIYAVALSNVISTYAIQKKIEKHDTGYGDRKKERYPYDPEEIYSDDQSAIWQFKEYVVHRIEKNEIIAGYKIDRKKYLVGQGQSTIAGIKFKLRKIWQRSDLPKSLRSVLNKANYTAKAYQKEFPKKRNQYLSYYGIIEDVSSEERPQTAFEARERYERGGIEQVSPLYDERDRKKQRTKNRRQKKRKKFRGKKRR